MRKIFLTAVLVAPLILTAQVSRYNQFRAHKFMMEGIKMLSMGNIDHGMAELERALQYDPFNREVYQLRADFNFSRGQYDNAVRDFSKAIELAPRNSQAMAELYNSRGKAQERLSRINEAFYDFERSLQIRPGYAEAQGNYNRVGAQLGFNMEYREPPRGSDTNPEQPPGYYPNPDYVPPVDTYDPYPNNNNTTGGVTDPYPPTYNIPDNNNPPGYRPEEASNRNYSYVYDRPYAGGTPSENVQISRIEVTRMETIVHLEARHTGRGSLKIFIARPGSPKAFFVEDTYSRRRYRLREMRGFERGFERTYKLRKGNILEFSLIFEPIPYDSRAINLLEGDTDDPRDKSWNFYDVELSRPMIRYEN